MKEVGIPRKKRFHDFLVADGVSGSCFFSEDKFYLFRSAPLNSGTVKNEIKEIDLDSYNGDEESYPNVYECEHEFGLHIRPSDNYITLVDYQDLLIDKTTMEVVISGIDELAKCSAEIKNISLSATKNYIFIIRHIENRDIFKATILNAMSKEVIRDLEVECRSMKFIGEDHISGFTANGDFMIYSVLKNECVFQLSKEKYFDSKQQFYDIFSAAEKDRLALGWGPYLIVVDTIKWDVILEVNCLKTHKVKEIMEYSQYSESEFQIRNISFHDNHIVINGNDFLSYVACLRINHTNNLDFLWGHFGLSLAMSKYVGGDLVFGTSKSRPVAWDLYTGELVWSATAALHCNGIVLNKNWLIYTHPYSAMHCFKWSKPYISSHKL